MGNNTADRNLLIGILALQMDFISRDQLVEGMNAWVLDKAASLDEFLVRQKAIEDSTRNVLLALVDKHLELHKNDPKQSLAAVNSIDSAIRDQLASVADPEVEHSLANVSQSKSSGGSADQDSTVLHGDWKHGGRFQVLRPHARGGLGKVSVALDNELHREVALKEIQEQHADNHDSQTRFVLEAEVTGGLEHPGIVPVYGLGRYRDGRPYYAMRFIRGDSLKEAVDRFHSNSGKATRQTFQSLEFRKLLGRFVDVCQAIDYAHSRGVLHRDLKPSNIMLGKFGETLVVDWGLSKVIGRQQAESPTEELTLQVSSGSSLVGTQVGTVIGTPAYMSPEQAAGKLDQLGPASDVYSLGAVIYYLLTGKTAFGQKDIGKLLRSVQAGTLKPPGERNPAIPNSLEAICLKAMSVDPSARYQAPGELADEVEQWLADEPVSAYREPVFARTWRWVKKHQVQTTGAATVVVAAIICLLVILGVVNQSRRDLNQTNGQLTQANESLAATISELDVVNRDLTQANTALAAAERTAREEKAIADAVNKFLRNDLLRQASPFSEPDRSITLRAVLDKAAGVVKARFGDQPPVEAALQHTIGNTYKDLGEFKSATYHLSRSYAIHKDFLRIDDVDSLSVMSDLGEAYALSKRYIEAETLLEEALDLTKRALGKRHHTSRRIMEKLAAARAAQGKFDQASELITEILAAGHEVWQDDRGQLGMVIFELAVILTGEGSYSSAEYFYSKAIDIFRAWYGESDPRTLAALSNLGSVYRLTLRYAKAELLYQKALEGQKKNWVNTPGHANDNPGIVEAVR